jgi:F0F1-type ATP synthase delta subunit
MKRATAYAHAIVQAYSKENASPESVVGALQTVLANRRETSLLPHIVRAVARELTKKETLVDQTLTVARMADAEPVRSDLLSRGVRVDHVRVDDRLVGGYAIGTSTQYSDQSFRTQLIHFFNSLV